MADSNNLTEADVLAMAQAADEGRDFSPTPKEDEKAKVETPATEKASGDNEQTPAPAEKAEQTKLEASDEVSSTKEKSEEDKSSLTTQSEIKSESASEKKPTRYEKAKSRLEKEWEDVRAEKARIKAEREQIEAERARKTSDSNQGETKSSSRKFSAEDYREAAKSYRDEGRDDLAKLAEQKSVEIESEDQKEQQAKIQNELKASWDKNLQDEVDSNPDLKDSSTPLYKAVSEMLQNHAILRNYPAGIKDAVGIAKVKLQAESASDLRKKVAEYESELAQLRKATTPASGQPKGPAKTKAFHELTLDEQERELMKMASEVDRG
jgi:hypothetical protein